ncbi:MAG: DUF302 domain-containing protein [Gammaproteobacteria bacterium]|nr:DUF302 domain-containing protein [Gammaproteobacteria bacterium]MDH5778101.1 DUF302 domain-containing protein [Gammaproteobacteria bacterium]
MKKLFSGLIILLLSLSNSLFAEDERDRYMKIYTISGSFEEVRDDLELAITGRGIRINLISHIGDMLVRTGKDIGRTKQVFAHAQAFEFCNSTVSRNTMEADPHNIVFCPYVIAVYSLPNEKDKTYVAYRRPVLFGSAKLKKALQQIEDMYEDIISELK